MSGAVRLLDDTVIDAIAAGEVVDRPFSVVKELVENALDAGASRVEVELSEGGKDLVRVSDDGAGMGRDDLALCIRRHATSKLERAEDLVGIRTLGFRGEALPSIAAVARVRIVTRPAAADVGHELRIEGGELLYLREAGAPSGTRVEVEDLFFNTPARRAFLKRASTELGHIAEWMQRLALSRPDVGFSLRQDGRAQLDAPPRDDLTDRVAAVLGRDVARDLVRVDAMEGELAVGGLIARPGRTRGTTASIHLTVDGRVVRDRSLIHAVERAYGTLLPSGRHPVAVLDLVLPPGEVDVNVHPAKTEVRFRDPQSVYRLVHHAVRDALKLAPWLGAGGDADAAGLAPDVVADAGPAGAPPGSPGRAEHDAGPGGLRPPGTGGGRDLIRERPPWLPAADVDLSASGRGDGGASPAVRLEARPVAAGEPGGQRRLTALGGFFRSLRPIGQLHRTYLVLESASGLVLLDQHAAHERVTFERLKRAWAERAMPMQALLVPDVIEVDAARAARVEELGEELERLGFLVEGFGDTAVVVKGVPAALTGRGVRELLGDLLEPGGLLGGTERSHAAIEEVLGRMACHGSVRAGREMTTSEIRALLEDLDRTDFRGNCPHGRNVLVEIPLSEIARKVDR